jgi:hypothetical protein
MRGEKWVLTMDKQIASDVNELMLDYAKKLDESLRLVMENCSEEEFKRYREAVGNIMTTMLLDVMNPIYAEYPDLKPAALSDPGTNSKWAA